MRETSNFFIPLVEVFGFRVGLFLSAKVLYPRDRQVSLRWRSAYLAGILPQFFSFFQKLGIPSATADCPLALSLFRVKSCIALKIFPDSEAKNFN